MAGVDPSSLRNIHPPPPPPPARHDSWAAAPTSYLSAACPPNGQVMQARARPPPSTPRPAPAPRPRPRQKLPGSERRPAARCCPRWWPVALHLKGPRLGPGPTWPPAEQCCALQYPQGAGLGSNQRTCWCRQLPPGRTWGQSSGQGSDTPSTAPGIHTGSGRGGADGLLGPCWLCCSVEVPNSAGTWAIWPPAAWGLEPPLGCQPLPGQEGPCCPAAPTRVQQAGAQACRRPPPAPTPTPTKMPSQGTF